MPVSYRLPRGSSQSQRPTAAEDYDTHTTVRDPNEKFTSISRMPNGKLVSNDDPRFKGKSCWQS